MIPRSRLVLAALILILPITWACSDETPAAGAVAATSERPPVAVTVVTAATASLTESIEVVGSLEPKFWVDVKSEVTGTVTEVFVTEWVAVKRGAPLARLDTTETEAGIEALKAAVAQARIAEARAKREYDRAQQLKEYGLITPQNYDEAKTAVEASESSTSATLAQVRAAEARLAKSLLKAPMDGVVALRTVNVGDRLENMGNNTPAFRIVDNRLLDLTVSVPATRLSKVKVGQPLEFTTDAAPGRTFRGKVMFINPALDEASRSARVIAEVPNTEGLLRGGSFAKGRIVVAERPDVLQVPREALLNWDLERRTADVFVVNGAAADRRAVQVGMTTSGGVEVLSGLTPGDRVVVRGGFALRPGDKVVVAGGQGA
jgi:RND family efflux transporter MFP subunit